MATGRKTVVVGQVLDPDAWGNPLWDQSVQTFASAADRTAQFPAPKQGATSWLEDVKQLQVFTGAGWVMVGVERAELAGPGAGENVPNGVLTGLGVQTINAADVVGNPVTVAGSVVTLNRAGYWLIDLFVQAGNQLGAGRNFVQIVAGANPVARSTIGNENIGHTVSAGLAFAAGTVIAGQVLQSSGAGQAFNSRMVVTLLQAKP